MEYEINVRVSNRHVHLTKETYDLLFDEDITKKYDLNQVGEFAANQVLTIRNGDKTIENVRVLGPTRSYNQIEISKRDARVLGVNPPVRRSGDLADSLEITLETPKNSVKTNGLIIANRHIHMNSDDALKYGVVDRQLVNLVIDGERGLTIESYTPGDPSDYDFDYTWNDYPKVMLLRLKEEYRHLIPESV